MDIDTAMAARFLTALTGDSVHTFQTLDDKKAGRRGLIRILHGTFSRQANTLATLNAKGAGVYVMVNRGDGMGRKADNVTGCRALFLDLDGSPIEPVLSAPIPPRIVVESSPGKWHAYWPIVDLPPGQFSAAQVALASMFDGDPVVHDKPRVMRLPGFLHNKATPFQTRLQKCEVAPLTWQEMADAFDLSRRMTLPAVIPEGERNSTLFKLAKSAAAKGVPEPAQLAKAMKVNAERCAVPLSEAEVAATVASAYKTRGGGFGIPAELVDSAAFMALDDAARLLLILAYRRADGFNGGIVTLPHSELRDWFPRKNTFQNTRKRAVASGLLTIVKPASPAMPRKGKGPTPTFYRLAIGALSAPYYQSLIGALSAPPEALQVLGIGGHEGGRQADGANDDAKPTAKRVGS